MNQDKSLKFMDSMMRLSENTGMQTHGSTVPMSLITYHLEL